MVDLSALPVLDRVAVLLAARDGETYRTVASILGESEQATRARIRGALAALRAALPVEEGASDVGGALTRLPLG